MLFRVCGYFSSCLCAVELKSGLWASPLTGFSKNAINDHTSCECVFKKFRSLGSSRSDIHDHCNGGVHAFDVSRWICPLVVQPAQ